MCGAALGLVLWLLISLSQMVIAIPSPGSTTRSFRPETRTVLIDGRRFQVAYTASAPDGEDYSPVHSLIEQLHDQFERGGLVDAQQVIARVPDAPTKDHLRRELIHFCLYPIHGMPSGGLTKPPPSEYPFTGTPSAPSPGGTTRPASPSPEPEKVQKEERTRRLASIGGALAVAQDIRDDAYRADALLAISRVQRPLDASAAQETLQESIEAAVAANAKQIETPPYIWELRWWSKHPSWVVAVSILCAILVPLLKPTGEAYGHDLVPLLHGRPVRWWTTRNGKVRSAEQAGEIQH
jgi:hypothetical protein